MEISERGKNITHFYAMELLEKARSLEAGGEDVIHMETGEPDFPTPALVKEAAMKAIEEGRTTYTPALGLPELRERIAEHYGKRDGISISPERVIVTNGSSGAFLLLFAVLLERGRVVGISDPGYPCYKNFVRMVDARPVSIPVSADTNFEVTPNHLRSCDTMPDMLVVTNPSNPTGTIYSETTLSGLYEALVESDKLLVVDEVYSRLTYGSRVRSALAISDDIIVVNGFSKSFAMTGWRLGWMVVPGRLVDPIHRIAQNVFIAPPTVSQYGALKAFDAVTELETMRRAYLLPELKRLGFDMPVDPQGAFYIYAGIERWGMDSMDFVDSALKEAGVVITPGHDF